MVLSIGADNCATNRAIVTRLGVPPIGMSFLSEYRSIIDQVQTLSTQLRYSNNAAELERHTRLKLLKANVTRWSSIFKMLQRYVKVRDAIKIVSVVKVLLPRPSTHRKIVPFVETLKDLDSVCINLQADDRTLADVRLLFDAVASKYGFS
ncbi:hypothetical protein PHPALM_28651 [Phytophthora palmivora]|uniref:Uncharacterized protein n=1 Tax=Phytophthora palmivora TaxID=4796 RepID=A0A2P4X9M5_9STRA|nr:hypothetical protein PHPALM_28651 [Phytophthora palmivora]